ncbi:alpha beta-hydrolase [Athelia psychrophila]|uniref:Alpha beta-hydrolase n=1 Tax=Athelia psychrophila TaxID=1759441 RepID=A0A166ISB4_9AGAM|nr:alpha beta-hydrolase [Fibularhizoctonia sp. CBS 109695]KZP20119.1 alpha beta-hydrolase [Fibularhizoctonia sp. CBS 109695]
MDPLRPNSFNHQFATLSTGHTYHYVDQTPKLFEAKSPESTQTLLCVHGFPDLWYGWRYQIKPWVEAGYRVIVPDMLGYGRSDTPNDVQEYSTKSLSNDLAALLDHLGLQKAVIIGHDWGCYTIGRFALWHPDRISSIIMMSVPYTAPTPKYMSLEDVVRHYADFSYQLYFANDKSAGEIESNLKEFFRLLFSPSGPGFGKGEILRDFVLNKQQLDPNLPCLLNDEELHYYVAQFKQAGMHGPLSYYRTSKARYDEERECPSPFPSHFPAILLWGTEDTTCPKFLIKKAYDQIPHMQDRPCQGKGHWLMLESRDEVTQQVLEWLSKNSNKSSRQRL